jgi:polyferredoxin
MTEALRRNALPIALVVIACGIMTGYFALQAGPAGEVVANPSWALQRHATENNVPVGKLVHELRYEYQGAQDWPVRGKHVSELPPGVEGIRHALEELSAESAVNWQTLVVFPLFGVFVIGALLTLHSRRDFSKWRWAVLAGGVALFGLWFAARPNPMEGVVKAFKYLVGLEASPLERVLVLAAFTLLAIAGNKLVCGWGCPLGSLQDVIHRFSPLKKWKPPFWLTNTLRVALFGVFLCLLFGWIFGVDRYVIYHRLNFFKLFTWSMAFPWWVLILAGLLCLAWYRPYCHLICPFGLWSWVAEHFSLSRVRISDEKCIRCQKCVKACPSHAANGRINSGGRRVGLPDCWACGACVEVCPTKAVAFDMPRQGYTTSLPPRGESEQT